MTRKQFEAWAAAKNHSTETYPDTALNRTYQIVGQYTHPHVQFAWEAVQEATRRVQRKPTSPYDLSRSEGLAGLAKRWGRR